MTNQVKIVVSGTNKFKPTVAEVVKALGQIKTVASEATKTAAKLDQELAKPKSAEVDKVAAALDNAGKKASLAAAETGKLNKEAAKPKALETDKVTKAMGEAAAAADTLIDRMRKVGRESSTSTKLPLGITIREAVHESSAALDELVMMLWRTGNEMGDAISRGLHLDRVHDKLSSIGVAFGAAMDRALEPVRRLRSAAINAADNVGEAWGHTTNRIEEALAAAARAAVAIGAAAMVPVRRVRTLAVETADAVSTAWSRAVDNVQAKSRAVGESVASTWERAWDRVQVKARETSQVIVYGYDRAMIPARRAASVVVEAAEKAERAWSRAAAPVARFGRAVGDVVGETASLAGRVLAPFGKVGSALVGVLADAGKLGGEAVVRGVGSALDGAGSVASRGAQTIGRSIASALDKAEDAVKAARRLGDKTLAAMSRAFTNSGEVSDALTDMLPKWLTNPAVLAAGAVAGTFVGAAVGGAIVFGLGAGMATAGIISAAGADSVKLAWKGLGNDLGKEMRTISAPFQTTLIDIADQARSSFATFKPSLQKAFGAMAPDVTKFSAEVFGGLARFAPALDPIQHAFSAVLDDIGGRMPDIVDDLADGFSDLSEAIEKNPEALGQFLELGGQLVNSLMSDLSALNGNFGDVNEELEMLGNWLEGKNYDLDINVDDNFVSGNVVAQATAMVDALRNTSESSYDAKSHVESLNEILLALADSEATVTDRGQIMLGFLNEMAGRSPTYEDGIQGIDDAIRELGDMFDTGKDKAKGFGDALLNPDGTISTFTANGSKLQDMLQGLQGNFANTAAGVRELEDAGWQHDDAVNKVNYDLNVQRDRLLAAADGMGLTRSQMEKVLEVYGLTPKQIDTLVHLDDGDARDRISWLTSDAYKNLYIRYFDPGAPKSSNNGWGVGGLAHGGVVSAAATGGPRGRGTLMNEQGPEIVNLPNGSMVIPSGMSENLRRGSGLTGAAGGGQTVVLEVRSSGSPVDDFLAELIRRYVRVQGGGDVQAAFGGRR